MTGKLSTLSALVLSMFLTGCVLPDDKPFNYAGIERQYARARENVTRELAPMPKKLDETYLTKIDGKPPTGRAKDVPATQSWIGPAVRMPLRDLIQLAAANSLDVKVAGYQPAIDEARVTEAEAR